MMQIKLNKTNGITYHYYFCLMAISFQVNLGQLNSPQVIPLNPLQLVLFWHQLTRVVPEKGL